MKAIREALRSMSLTHDVRAALAEVKAIEQAAKVVAVQGIYEAEYDTTDERLAVERADMLFERIAKEAP